MMKKRLWQEISFYYTHLEEDLGLIQGNQLARGIGLDPN